MSDSVKVSLTAVFGVFVFVAGQLLQRIFIEPLQDLRKNVGRIAFALTFYANFAPSQAIALGTSGTFGQPPEKVEEVMAELRRLGSDLRALPLVISAYSIFALIRLVPSIAAINTASGGLTHWSNSIGESNHDTRVLIATALKLKVPGLYPT